MEAFDAEQEYWNTRTHALGAVIAVFAAPALFTAAYLANHTPIAEYVGLAVYSFGFIMVFSFSALYHYFESPRRKDAMEIWDHFGIYFMISGTYTPFVLRYADAKDALWLLTTIWGIAAVGTIFKAIFPARFRIASMLLYVALGLVIILAPSSFKAGIPDDILVWIVAGACCYIFGLIFYIWAPFRHHHAVWHLFVLAGAIAHYIGIITIYC